MNKVKCKQHCTTSPNGYAGGLDVPIHTIDDLQEVSFGPYEGVMHYEVDWIQDWLQGGHVDGVEGYDAFIERCRKAINHALGFEGPVLIVAHGGLWIAAHEFVTIKPHLVPMPNALPIHVTPGEAGWHSQVLGQ